MSGGGTSSDQQRLEKDEDKEIARQNATENDLRKQKFQQEEAIFRRQQGGFNGGLSPASAPSLIPTNRTLGG